ncbi:ATP-binding protein [Dyadobacter sp. LJ53]|uniref:AAA family ATPase n=1 Tax=Dyadobacter chenwenxiniae TaxID=2906456 RepID=UPI001F1FAE3F|nr:ATP-binding protein [Dyadobacter chenwenxiniae]MCF0049229.1 ATP-binding protein [Dyadobacter chenwenxiniae]
MIVEFSVKNFRSINTLQTLSFVATGLKSADEYSEVDENNICEEGDLRLLKTVGIYGANGSGKSNIISALNHFLTAIKSEASASSNLEYLNDPFLYQDNSEQTESFFQIVLLLNGRKFRYGFTVKEGNRNSNDQIVTNEWLFGIVEKNMSAYFTREGLVVSPRRVLNAEKIPSELPYNHSLYLTQAAAFDGTGICARIRQYLKGRTLSNSANGSVNFRRHSFKMVEQEDTKETLIYLLSVFNLKFTDITIQDQKDNEKGLNKIYSLDRIDFWKIIKLNETEKKIRLNLIKNESAGTQKLFELAGFLLSVFSMSVGGLLILDEIDSNFHPSLLIKLISLFNDPLINSNRTQLLFTSHDTNLLSPAIMRRDQFYFAEKLEDDSTRLYSLADLKGIRNDADFAKSYLAGLYGATPTLDKYLSIDTKQEYGTMEL